MIVEFVTYLPLLLLVVFFKKTQPRNKKSSKLEKVLKKITGKVQLPAIDLKKPDSNEKKRKIKFPWYFKIFLYIFSLMSMVLSIAFVLFKGNII